MALTEVIGTSAMLEQTAEEATELAQACLKVARFLRKENPVYKSEPDLYSNLSEEIADVYICLEELFDNSIVTEGSVKSEILYKKERMKKRLAERNDLL
jgi:NTP pyrophosphatase (non-canonical NTP hydrolase)